MEHMLFFSDQHCLRVAYNFYLRQVCSIVDANSNGSGRQGVPPISRSIPTVELIVDLDCT